MHLNSFLIRCWLDGERPDVFVAQHVRSGEQYRSSDWVEVGDWIRQKNRHSLTAPETAEPCLPGVTAGEDEEAQ
ncbi:MAG: hypothetical protein NTZ56_23580 [Acidobacteria bacterium]|nr:hypothetical protein [Acidobacteriota bacterium]